MRIELVEATSVVNRILAEVESMADAAINAQALENDAKLAAAIEQPIQKLRAFVRESRRVKDRVLSLATILKELETENAALIATVGK